MGQILTEARGSLWFDYWLLGTDKRHTLYIKTVNNTCLSTSSDNFIASVKLCHIELGTCSFSLHNQIHTYMKSECVAGGLRECYDFNNYKPLWNVFAFLNFISSPYPY